MSLQIENKSIFILKCENHVDIQEDLSRIRANSDFNFIGIDTSTDARITELISTPMSSIINDGIRKIVVLWDFLLSQHFGNRFEPGLGGLFLLKRNDTIYKYAESGAFKNKNNIYSNSMKTNRNELIRRLLTGVTGDELRNLVLVREEARRPIPAPRKIGVKQLIRYFENNPILPYRPVPAPRMKKQQPVPIPRTKIVERKRAFSGYTKSYEIKLKPTTDPLIQFQNTRLAIGRLLDTKLQEMGGGGA